MMKLAILGSTRGTNLEAILAAIQRGLAAEVSIVISNKPDAFILERAKQHHILAEAIVPHQLTREEYDDKLSTRLQSLDIDLIVLIGYMRILSAKFVQTWQGKIINVHPSLLPLYAGLMNLDVHQTVIADGRQESGCTVHYVTADVDAGPILIQKKCVVLPTDTAETLKGRVQQLEGQALVDAIKSHAASQLIQFNQSVNLVFSQS